MHAISIPGPPPQFAVVVLTTDPRTLEQYNGLVATQQKTAAMSKGKGKVVATIEDESDYGQFSSEDEQESEEGESAAQHFYELKQLYKYYANDHVPQHDRVVTYMLISELLLFAQQLNNSLHNCTMQVLLSDPLYWDLKNPI
ncbi:hypothetical protein C0995_008267 [Termitomyces sp. Mi166|nr:hypothetical protein C0995_008267 [Termitomyces sp. Mi166\